MSARLPLLALLLCAGAARAAAPVEVISPRPDSVSVTIYRDLFALVTETRTVDLPEGPVKLSFDGVVETLLPASAVVADTGRALEERNYDFQQLTPQSLFRGYIGREVLVMRTHTRTGKVARMTAVIESAGPRGIVMRSQDGTEVLHCSGLPEHVIFENVPDDLQRKPRLSVQLAAGSAGKRTVRVSYLAHGFAWKSDYVARLSESGRQIDLQGWATLRNLTNASFADAQVQLVAGRLHLLDVKQERGTGLLGNSDHYPPDESLRMMREETLEAMVEEQLEAAEDYDDGEPQLFSECVSGPVLRMRTAIAHAPPLARAEAYGGGDELDEVLVTGVRASILEREQIADYQLYRLPWRTDLPARQTKQALFLDKRAVEVERFYGLKVNAFGYSDDEELVTPALVLGFENRKSSGLGEPLPEGTLRMFEPGSSGDLFSGEGRLGDTAVGVPVEVPLAGAIDLYLDMDVDEVSQQNPFEGTQTHIANAQVRISNAKGVPVDVEIRQYLHEFIANAKVSRASHRTLRKFGDYSWRVRVPANSAGTLSYRISYVETDED